MKVKCINNDTIIETNFYEDILPPSENINDILTVGKIYIVVEDDPDDEQYLIQHDKGG